MKNFIIYLNVILFISRIFLINNFLGDIILFMYLKYFNNVYFLLWSVNNICGGLIKIGLKF